MTTGGEIAAGSYCRISQVTAEERRRLREEGIHGLGVQRQQEDNQALCEHRGWQVARVYIDDDISAYSLKKARPAYQRMLEDLRNGAIQAVVAWHADRLHRHPRELEDFIELVQSSDAQVATVKAGTIDLTTAAGRAVARTLGAWARYESEVKSDRVKRKHVQLADAGKDVGGGRPFGYEDDRHTVRESEAKLIREAVVRVLDGESMRSVCRDWNERGVRTATGKFWAVQIMRRTLASARISGRREYRAKPNGRGSLDIGRITARAEWDAIISYDESDRLRDLLRDPDRRKNVAMRSYLLTGGLARCGLCGKPLTARPRDGQRSMVCASGPGFYGCGKIRVLAEPLEELVSAAVLSRVDEGALAALLAAKDDRKASEGLEATQRKLDELAEMWTAEEITRGEWQRARKILDARREALQRQVEARRRSISLDGLDGPLRELWPTLPLRKKRVVIVALIEAIVVGPTPVRGRNRFDPARILPPLGEIRWRA